MNLQENIIILKSIAKKIANKLHCDRHGSCVHFAEIFVDEVNEQYPELLNDFDVIEGYVNVKFGGGIPQEHTWIKLNNGVIIDPTFSQFDKYDKNAQYSKKRTKVYSGQEYYDEGKEGSWFSERRKKLPSSVFKEEKIESIKRILKEETSIERKLLNSIEKIGVLRTSKMVGGINRLLKIIGKNKLNKEQKVNLIIHIVEEYGEDEYFIDVSEYDIFVDLDINFTRTRDYTTEVTDLYFNGRADIQQYPYDYETDDYDYDNFKRKGVYIKEFSESDIDGIISKLIRYKKL
jgi:hypothetical protein